MTPGSLGPFVPRVRTRRFGPLWWEADSGILRVGLGRGTLRAPGLYLLVEDRRVREYRPLFSERHGLDEAVTLQVRGWRVSVLAAFGGAPR